MSTSEYEREPVPEKALLGFKNFIGMYAGEHCAGTELMIGPLFVAAGVSAFDVLTGLLIGNLLAVLSWILLYALQLISDPPKGIVHNFPYCSVMYDAIRLELKPK